MATTQEREHAVRRRVLVVDDNRDITEAISTIVRLLGHDVRVASDGASALALAEEFHPDLVLLDIGMPGMDGFEVARRLREAGETPVQLVAVTGWGDRLTRERSVAAGFDQHIVKPIGLAHLRALLARPREGSD